MRPDEDRLSREDWYRLFGAWCRDTAERHTIKEKFPDAVIDKPQTEGDTCND